MVIEWHDFKSDFKNDNSVKIHPQNIIFNSEGQAELALASRIKY